MTDPSRANCPHSGEGWCIGCVAELSDSRRELERENADLQRQVIMRAREEAEARSERNLLREYTKQARKHIGRALGMLPFGKEDGDAGDHPC